MNEPHWSPEVARAMHEFGNAAPLPPTASRVSERQKPGRRRPITVSLIAAALALAGVIGTIALVTRDRSAQVGTTEIVVHHERYAVSVTARLECDTPIDPAGTFDAMTIDTWSDRAGRQWRSRVTYPDGTTLDTIVRGSVIYPVEQFQQGERRDRAVGCVGPNDEPFVLAGADPFFTLTLAPDLAPDEFPYVRLYNQVGALVDVHGTDSQGRPGREWEQRTSGTAGYGNDANLPVEQVTHWFVDPADLTTVNERTFTTTVETMGTATLAETLVQTEDISATSDLFSTEGHRALGGTRRPAPPGAGPGTSVVASPTTDVAPDSTSTDGDCAGADLDIAHEPPLWRQPNNATWFRNGCVVRIDVITDRPGPDHCGWGSARVIIVAQPLGDRYTTDPVQYVRDPANAFAIGLDAGYDGNATLPATAGDTGYRTDTEQLWTVPGDDRFIYLVLDGRTERWPKGESPVCS